MPSLPNCQSLPLFWFQLSAFPVLLILKIPPWAAHAVLSLLAPHLLSLPHTLLLLLIPITPQPRQYDSPQQVSKTHFC